jgi:hypothetical protein
VALALDVRFVNACYNGVESSSGRGRFFRRRVGKTSSLTYRPRLTGAQLNCWIVMGNTDLITVYVASNFAAAQLLCGLLLSEGLHARVAGEELSDEFGMSLKMGTTEVGVPLAEKERADDIVAAWQESKGASS